MGWALKVATKSSRFSTAQKKYFSQQFFIGEERGKKADPKEVALDMRQARDENGVGIFVGNIFFRHNKLLGSFLVLRQKCENLHPA